MKIKIERVNGLLRLPEDVCILEGITPDGSSYKYKIYYEANISKAIKNKAVFVKIRFLKDETKLEKFHIFTTGLKTENIVSNLLLQKSFQKDLARTKNNLLLFETRSDISKKIPNNEIKNISSNPAVMASSSKTITPEIKQVSELKNKNETRPVLEKNLAAFTDGLGISQKTFKQEAKTLLRINKIDPAIFIGSKSRTIISAKNSFSGLVAKKGAKTKNIQTAGRKLELVKENLLSTTNVSNTKGIAEDQYVNVVELTSNEFVTVQEYVEIPMDLLKNPTFVIEFEVFNNKGLSQQIISQKINHKEKLDNMLIPAIAPTITASPIQKPGKSLFLLKQNDPNSSQINIYRKTIPSDEINNDSDYVFVKSVDVDKKDGLKMFIDSHCSINPTIYRAIPVGKNGMLGFEFDSVVISQERNAFTSKNSSINKKDTTLTLTHELNQNYVNLFVSNIPPEPIAFEIFRKDLSLNTAPVRISNRISLKNERNSAITFQDTTAKKKRIYRYFCKLIYKNGDVQAATNDIVVKVENIESNIAKINLTTPVVSVKDLDITFSIVKNASLKEIDIVKKILSEQNILTEYEDEILNEKEKLQDLFFVRVLRTNMTTGEIEDFGVVDSLDFSDKKYGQPKNIKPLEVGFEYKYTIMVYALPAEILFKKYTREVTRSSTTYTLNPSKWLHPITLSEGNIVSESSLKSRYSNSSFTFGKVADIHYLDVSLKNILPSVQSSKAQVVGKEKVLIRWKINGEPKKIDHFIISLESFGARTIVGKSHNITSTNDFQFVDILDNGEHGALHYIITPVYFDYSQGTEVVTNVIFI